MKMVKAGYWCIPCHCCLGFVLLTAAAQAAEPIKEVASGARDREAVAVTIYNDDLGLVRERRRIDLPAGRTRLWLGDVAAHMRAETALLREVKGPAVSVLEQQFDFDLLTARTLLEKNLGHDVTVLRTNPSSGEDRRERATVLAVGEGPVLRFADRIEAGVPGRLAFDRVPEGLHEQPTLSVLLDAAGGRQTVELSYLTSGMSWRADYAANLAVDGKSLELTAWVTLTNRSGLGFDDAALQLVAGSVHRARAPGLLRERAMAPMLAARAAAAEPAEETLLDYHLYRYERPTSIADNQTKQLALLTARQVPVRREYLLAGSEWMYRDKARQAGQKQKPSVFLSFDNKGGQLGQPLPAGIVRVFAPDATGAAQFVGEDRMEHTPKNETVKLDLGEAFDVSAERTQSAFHRLAKNVVESSWRIELRNARDEPVTVTVLEPMPDDWEIVQESQAHSKDSAHEARWQVQIPAGGTSKLEYAVRVTS
ncbi:conserved exported hypothetical protein [Burkholderiales bacterium]|nr:conserved exported hypothetical protein [Burkholderiales bacterium]